MLPRAGVYYFPWEISSGAVPEGETVRTFGRFHCYNLVESRVTLVAQHESVQHQVHVCTRLVEPFRGQAGSLYVVLGEYERSDDKVSVVKARVLTCVEGINLPLLERAVRKQREYEQERRRPRGRGSPELEPRMGPGGQERLPALTWSAPPPGPGPLSQCPQSSLEGQVALPP